MTRCLVSLGEAPVGDDDVVSHGICDACSRSVLLEIDSDDRNVRLKLPNSDQFVNVDADRVEIKTHDGKLFSLTDADNGHFSGIQIRKRKAVGPISFLVPVIRNDSTVEIC